MSRAKFDPAHETDGSPVYGVYKTTITWVVAEAPHKVQVSSADLDITVASLPAGVESPSIVNVNVAVDATGKLSTCAGAEPVLPSDSRNNPLLVPIACEQLIKSYKGIAAQDSRGTPVPSVQTAAVRFTKQ